MAWPLPFIQRMSDRLGAAQQSLLAALAQPPTIAIRTNPRKPLPSLPWPTTPVPWSQYGHYLDKRPAFTLFPPLHAGGIYVQEPSSMFLEQALQVVGTTKPMLALDLCGAPGGKTTHLLSLLSDDSILVSNEVIRSRVSILEEHVIKWGASNTLVTAMDPDVMAKKGISFDLVVVDAPCSGEGLFRKDPGAADEWSLQNVQVCSARQERILAAAMAMTAPGGYLVYSTCTFEAEENETHSAAFRDAGWQFCPIPMGEQHGITPIHYQGHPAGYQFYPHSVRGEGFYLSLWQKPGNRADRHWMTPSRNESRQDWPSWVETPDNWVALSKNGKLRLLPRALSGSMQHLAQQLRPVYYGVEAFEEKGKLLRPAHALALSECVSTTVPSLSLTTEEALRYLAREPLSIESPKGWLLVRYEGMSLGWAKGLGHRINNYYPQHWRIMNLDKLR